MEKTFTKMEIAIIKRTAQNVVQFVTKKEKYKAQIEEIQASREKMIAEKMKSIEELVDKSIATKVEKLAAEIALLQPIIDGFQGPIKEMTGGYTTEDLVDRVVEGTGKINEATGKENMTTRFVLKYPDTVVPPCENEAGSKPADAEPANEAPATEGTGNEDPFANMNVPPAAPETTDDGSDDASFEAAKEAAESAFSDDEENW